MPRGPVFSPPPGTGKSKQAAPKAFVGPRGECEGCLRGDGRVPCTCTVQDRCNATNDAGHQCIRGVSHPGLRHVTAAGKHFT